MLLWCDNSLSPIEAIKPENEGYFVCVLFGRKKNKKKKERKKKNTIKRNKNIFESNSKKFFISKITFRNKKKKLHLGTSQRGSISLRTQSNPIVSLSSRDSHRGRGNRGGGGHGGNAALGDLVLSQGLFLDHVHDFIFIFDELGHFFIEGLDAAGRAAVLGKNVSYFFFFF